MYSLLRIITTTIVAAHSALGCCWHHQHTYAHAGDATTTACCHVHQDETSHDGDDGEPQDREHRPHDEPCDEGHCVYVHEIASDSIEMNSSIESLGFIVLSEQETEAHTVGWDQLWLNSASPPVRPHLLKQVFLL